MYFECDFLLKEFSHDVSKYTSSCSIRRTELICGCPRADTKTSLRIESLFLMTVSLPTGFGDFSRRVAARDVLHITNGA